MDNSAVLEVAMAAYWQNDPADVSVNAICQMARISKPSLYREFGNEDGLSSAVLDHYAELVLSDMFAILQAGHDLRPTLDALIDFACADARMETGCLFHKMRFGKHRLGQQTRARVEEIHATAIQAVTDFLEGRRKAKDWNSDEPADLVARYLVEQIGLACTQRAAQEDSARVRGTLTLALSAIRQG